MGKESVPAVSIIIPCYNMAGFLPDSLSSLANQSFRDFEVVIVDDCSSDDTERVVGVFSKKLDIRFFRLKKHSNTATARNFGIKNSQGKLVAFLDADDVLLPDSLEARHNAFQCAPASTSLVYGKYECFGLFEGNEKKNFPSLPFDRKLLWKKNFVPLGSVMVKKRLLEKAGLFNSFFSNAEDYELWLRLSAFCDFLYIPRVLYRKRIHSSSKEFMRKTIPFIEILLSFLCQFSAGASIFWRKFFG